MKKEDPVDRSTDGSCGSTRTESGQGHKYWKIHFLSLLNHIKTNDICVRSKIYLKWIYNRKLVSFYSRTKREMTCLVPISYFEEKSTSKLGGCFIFMIFLTTINMYLRKMSA